MRASGSASSATSWSARWAPTPTIEGEETYDVYQRAKGRADEALIASGLEHVIVRPGRLTDDQGTGRVSAGSNVGYGEIPREDVAEVLSQALRAEAAAGHVIEVVGGETPVAEAIDLDLRPAA